MCSCSMCAGAQLRVDYTIDQQDVRAFHEADLAVACQKALPNGNEFELASLRRSVHENLHHWHGLTATAPVRDLLARVAEDIQQHRRNGKPVKRCYGTDAADELIRQHRPQVRRYCAKRLAGGTWGADADDLANDVFERALSTLRVAPRALISPVAWLQVLAKTDVSNHHKLKAQQEVGLEAIGDPHHEDETARVERHLTADARLVDEYAKVGLEVPPIGPDSGLPELVAEADRLTGAVASPHQALTLLALLVLQGIQRHPAAFDDWGSLLEGLRNHLGIRTPLTKSLRRGGERYLDEVE